MMRGLLTKNIGLKVLSLFFAAALWFFVVGEKGAEIGFLIPLEFQDVPEDLIVSGAPPREIEVRVTGSKVLLANISPRQISASIDMSMSRPGLNNYRVRPDDIKIPQGISVIRVSPSRIKVSFDKLITKMINVKLRSTGQLASGYELSDIKTDPEAVEVSGIEKRVKKLRFLYTKQIDIDGVTADRKITVLLEIPENGISKVSPDKVTVNIIIKGREDKK